MFVTSSLPLLLDEIRGCTLCEPEIEARPVVQAGAQASLLIAGHAPGSKVHKSGVPWDDASGSTLRDWLGIDAQTFYDPAKVALVPMGFCYPGRGKSGDKAPRSECRRRWHGELMPLLPKVRLTLLLGQFAQRYHLGAESLGSVTANVKAWRRFGERIPLPHPSPRNLPWRRKHPFFERELLPELRHRVAALALTPG